MFKCHNVVFDCIPCDYLDRFRARKPTFLVVNTDDSGQPGTHWVAIAVLDKIYFMCSYGVRMQDYGEHFSKFALKLRKRVVQSNICLQAAGSDVCGIYAIYFLYCKFKNESFYTKFSKNVHKNDLRVRSFIIKFKKCINKTKNVQSCKKK